MQLSPRLHSDSLTSFNRLSIFAVILAICWLWHSLSLSSCALAALVVTRELLELLPRLLSKPAVHFLRRPVYDYGDSFSQLLP